MSKISNRFFVTAIEDGITLHGSILTTRPLVQAWNGSAATPDWTSSADQPVIYLNVFSGTTAVYDDNITNITWYYDNNPITFSGDVSIDGKFQKLSYTDKYPALKILDNFADGSTNTHIITCEALYVPQQSTSGIQIKADIRMSLTSIISNGYFGIIDFDGGKNYFEKKGEYITLFTRFYGSGSNAEIDGNDYVVSFNINGVPAVEERGAIIIGTHGTNSAPSLTIYEGAITDNAIIRADFTKEGSSSVDFSAYASIDDLTDPEYMYIQYNNQNGSSATLHYNGQVTFYIWVGQMDSTTPNQDYNHFELQLIDAEGKVDMAKHGGVPDCDSNGWRTLDYDTTGGYTDDKKRAHVTINYDLALALGNNITGIVRAEHRDTNE